MIVVFDTNIYISSFVFPGGTCDQAIRLSRRDKIEVYVSPDILTELKKVLTEKFKFTEEEAEGIIDRVLAIAKLIYPRFRVNEIDDMEDDNRILECADEAKADFLVTGDKKHILPLKRFRDTRIISPRQYLDLLAVQKI